MTALGFIIWKRSDEAPSQEAGIKPRLCGFKSASFMIREISPNYQIIYLQRKALVTSTLRCGKEAAVETDLLLGYELAPVFQRNTKFSTWIQFSAATWGGRSWAFSSSQMKAAVNQNICTWG